MTSHNITIGDMEIFKYSNMYPIGKYTSFMDPIMGVSFLEGTRIPFLTNQDFMKYPSPQVQVASWRNSLTKHQASSTRQPERVKTRDIWAYRT